jgi:hypothetical protein
MISKENKFLHDINLYLKMIFDFLIQTLNSFIFMVTLHVSINRLYAIECPLNIRNFLINVYSKYIFILILMFLMIVNVPSIIFCNNPKNENFKTIYCSIVFPIIFNIVPIGLEFFINLILFSKVIKYQKKKFSIVFNLPQTIMLKYKLGFYLNKKKTLKRMQLAKQIFALILTTWCLFSTFIYFSLNTYLSLNVLINYFNLFFLYKVQKISLIFFNLNHCINFFFYICFHQSFRNYLIFKLRALKKYVFKILFKYK